MLSGTNRQCPFCDIPEGQIFHSGQFVVAFWNPFSAVPGEALVATRRHVENWFSLTDQERDEFERLIGVARNSIATQFGQRQIGIQIQAGLSELSKSPHAHAHLIPVGNPLEADSTSGQSDGDLIPRSHIAEPAATYDDVFVPEPNSVQREALQALELTRIAGHQSGLVVLATGLGKTWLSAFDSNKPEFNRILFVAHREEILGQAFDTYSRIRDDRSLGYYSGLKKDAASNVLFASVQTLGRHRHLRRFAPDHFDYVIIDEFHHAAAQSYRRLLEHFRPRFLLGMTATPERMDGQDLLALCGENLVYQCDLREGIERGLLVPFHYYGVPDEVDYRNIPWRSGRFDEESLTTAVATNARAENALEQFQQRGGGRTLAFCASQHHANFMNDFFRSRGYRTVVVHSGPESAPRAESLSRLESGELDVIFSVDMLNEGVDLPNVDTVLMLRPTESPVVWRQQLGRGLRIAPDKSHLTVIDYIGNHRLFLDRIAVLFEMATQGESTQELVARLETGNLELPAGCAVTYDLESIDILRRLTVADSRDDDWPITPYKQLRDQHGVRPTAVEMFQSGVDMRTFRQRFGSWLEFVDLMGDLSHAEAKIYRRHRHFFEHLEATAMSRSYKMVVLLAMLEHDQIPGSMTFEELCDAVRRLASKRPSIMNDIGSEVVGNHGRLSRMLTQNPVNAWTGGKATGHIDYFVRDTSSFSTSEHLSELSLEERDHFQDLTRELAELRLAQYIARSRPQLSRRIVCNVSQSHGRPILFLPARSRSQGIPMGPMRVVADRNLYEAQFAKIAVNVLRETESGENRLPEVLRNWFGPEAGQPGTGNRVVFELSDDIYVLRPIGGTQSPFELNVWRSYLRRDVPQLFRLEFSPATWNQGIVLQDDKLILFVTLDKSHHESQHHYDDRFLSGNTFQWQSQNRTTRASKVGGAIHRNKELGITVHLFVRGTKRDKRGRGAEFIYCGELDFIDWKGEQPITVWWRLKTPIPQALSGAFGVPNRG